MDVKVAFLHGDLQEDIYMVQLTGFIERGKEHMICKLNKLIYGLKQASRQWYLKFDQVVTSHGFIENKLDLHLSKVQWIKFYNFGVVC